MHVTCLCGEDHPGCIEYDDFQDKMTNIQSTTDHDRVTCPICLRIIEWDEDGD